jgi:DNA polymerase-1|tara:strand:+ start:277 stop:966 length:690 start_codon:yes stop_codon:yes gene_type:complete
VILIDGDMLVYRVGFACDEESEKIAIQTMANYISELISDLSEHYDNHKLYLTGSSNFRNEVAVSQPYKGGRPSRKPVHKDLLREYMLDAWKAELSDNMEADDCIAIKSTELEHKSIICSLDKDFLQIPTKIYDYTKKIMKEVDERSATEWLYRQALMGDRVDNIAGVNGIGPKKAEKALDGWTTERELYERCLKLYEDNELNADRLYESLQLLYLLRSADDKYRIPDEV